MVKYLIEDNFNFYDELKHSLETEAKEEETIVKEETSVKEE